MRRALVGILMLWMWMAAAAEGAELRELLSKLKDADNEVRRNAAKELAELGADAKDAISDLNKALRDKDLFVRRYAAEALGNIGPDAKAAIPALAALMNDEKKEVMTAAVDALGKIGPASIHALTAALKDPTKDPAVRAKAALGLAKIGKQARGAVPALTDILNGKVKMAKGTKGKGNDNDIRVEAATALGAIAKAEDKDAIEALKGVSEGKQKNKALQKAAQSAIKEITGVAPKKKKK